MLYVAAGLVAMFAALAFLGLGAIDEATQLVFQERLATAYTTAGILERDLARVASDTNEATATLLPPASAPTSVGAAQVVLDHFSRVSPYPFFRVVGVWLVDADEKIVDAAGSPAPTGVSADTAAIGRLLPADGAAYAVRSAVGPVPGATAFAAVAVRLTPVAGAAQVAIVHTISINGTSDYLPESYGAPVLAAVSASPAPAPANGYHLEVVDPSGIAVLGIGSDERPGKPSRHFGAIETIMGRGAAAAMLHKPLATDAFEPHVMAVVPLAASPFYVVLEQPVDIALALPHQLGERLLIATSLGFLAALGVAWVTTRHVVKPTELLTAAAGRMARGDLTSPIDVRADDETGLLAESLEVMRRQLAAARDATERTKAELEARVADRTVRLKRLLGETINAQEEERRRLARELHDETAQTLAALTITLDRARDELSEPSSDPLALIGEARATAARLLAETRRLILGLRPAVLDDLGLLPAIRWYAETTLADSGVEVEIEPAEAPARLPADLEVALFRIVQEAITNVARHARARHVSIRFAFEAGQVTVTIVDDGVGFDVDRAAGRTPAESASIGLIGMQERVRLLDGEIEIHSSPRGGTTIVVRVTVIPEAT
jgi:signal transduction histidine kinase